MGTKKGEDKVFEIKYSPYHYWYVRLSGGGQLPEELSGHFSRELKAQEAINRYLEKRKPKRVKEDA